MQEKLLEINNLKVTFENKLILKNINLNIKKGETHALMGPNGSGKSTLAYIVSKKPKYKMEEGIWSWNEIDEFGIDLDDIKKTSTKMSFF